MPALFAHGNVGCAWCGGARLQTPANDTLFGRTLAVIAPPERSTVKYCSQYIFCTPTTSSMGFDTSYAMKPYPPLPWHFSQAPSFDWRLPQACAKLDAVKFSSVMQPANWDITRSAAAESDSPGGSPGGRPWRSSSSFASQAVILSFSAWSYLTSLWVPGSIFVRIGAAAV